MNATTGTIRWGLEITKQAIGKFFSGFTVVLRVNDTTLLPKQDTDVGVRISPCPFLDRLDVSGGLVRPALESRVLATAVLWTIGTARAITVITNVMERYDLPPSLGVPDRCAIGEAIRSVFSADYPNVCEARRLLAAAVHDRFAAWSESRRAVFARHHPRL